MIFEYWQFQTLAGKFYLLAVAYFLGISTWRSFRLIRGLQLFSWEPRDRHRAFPYLPPVEATAPERRVLPVEAEIFYAADLFAADVASIRRASGSILFFIAAMVVFDLARNMNSDSHRYPMQPNTFLISILEMLETARAGTTASLVLFVTAGIFERKLAQKRAAWRRFFTLSRAPTPAP